jgi:hypothetical protein
MDSTAEVQEIGDWVFRTVEVIQWHNIPISNIRIPSHKEIDPIDVF